MRRLFFCLATAIALSANGTGATTDPRPPDSVVVLTDSVIVTANRFGIDRNKLVWPARLISRSQLEQASDLGTALTAAGGVDVRDYNGSGSVATLSNWGTFNRHMLLLYDGRVVRDYSLGGFNLTDYSPDEFDRVELVKGPQSAFYGSDAIGGVLNLIPRTTLFDRVRVATQWGNFAYRRHRLDLSHALGRFGLGGWTEFMNTDNARPNAGADQKSFGLRSDFLSGSAAHHAWISARLFDDSLGVPGPVPAAGELPSLGGEESSSLYDHQTDRNFSVDVHYAFHRGDNLQIQCDAFSERNKLTYISNYVASWADPVDTVSTATTYHKRSSGLSGRISTTQGKHTIATGVDWLYGLLDYEYQESGNNDLLPDRWRHGQHQVDSWLNLSSALGSIVHSDLSGRLALVAGKQVQPSYDLGLVLFAEKQWQFRVGYGYAFRYPGLADQFAVDAYTRGNPDLAPEVSHSLSAGTSWRSLTGDFRVEGTVFRQRISSLIQYIADPVTYLYVPHNVNRFKSDGIDITVAVQPATRWSCDLAAVYQRAQQTTDQSDAFGDAYYVPDLTWTFHSDYEFTSKLKFGGSVRYVSERWTRLYGSTDKTIARVYEFGLTADLALSRSARLFVSGEDLTDRKRPSQFGYSLTDRDYPSLGRRLSVKLVVSTGR
jgi:vitamin B12 transporter